MIVADFRMDTKSAGLAVVTAHTSIPLQIKELPVLIVRTDGVVDVTAQARFNAKNVCSRNVFGRGVFEMRSSLNILSTQAFPLHWFHHLCSLSQASSYPSYLIFVLLTSPVLGIVASLAFSEVRCFVYVTDIHVHGTKDDFVTMSDKVHSKAIIKETTVMITCHTWDRCLLSQPTPSCQPTPKSY